MNSNKRIYLDGIEKSLLEKCKQRILVISVVFFVSFLMVNLKLIVLSQPLKEKEEVVNNTIKNKLNRTISSLCFIKILYVLY